MLYIELYILLYQKSSTVEKCLTCIYLPRYIIEKGLCEIFFSSKIKISARSQQKSNNIKKFDINACCKYVRWLMAKLTKFL